MEITKLTFQKNSEKLNCNKWIKQWTEDKEKNVKK